MITADYINDLAHRPGLMSTASLTRWPGLREIQRANRARAQRVRAGANLREELTAGVAGGEAGSHYNPRGAKPDYARYLRRALQAGLPPDLAEEIRQSLNGL